MFEKSVTVTHRANNILTCVMADDRKARVLKKTPVRRDVSYAYMGNMTYLHNHLHTDTLLLNAINVHSYAYGPRAVSHAVIPMESIMRMFLCMSVQNT